jgi:hypothetical protein
MAQNGDTDQQVRVVSDHQSSVLSLQKKAVLLHFTFGLSGHECSEPYTVGHFVSNSVSRFIFTKSC